MKWCSHNGTPLLGVTSSSGQFDLYSLVENNKGYKLENMSLSDVRSPNLSLSLDWCNSTVPRISDSGGFVSVLRLAENGDEVLLDQKWKVHNFDAWITAYNRWNKHVVYSGGDDCLLKGWDTRSECYKPIFVSKSHTMGVCAVQSSPLLEHVFSSGSYDEQVHIWDSRLSVSSLLPLRISCLKICYKITGQSRGSCFIHKA